MLQLDIGWLVYSYSHRSEEPLCIGAGSNIACGIPSTEFPGRWAFHDYEFTFLSSKYLAVKYRVNFPKVDNCSSFGYLSDGSKS